MKITFDINANNQNIEKTTTAYRNTTTQRAERTNDYVLDISGSSMDNNAYREHGKTTEEVMQQAGLVDVATQRDYMTVMSNCMSEEDFARLKEEGYQPGNMEIEEVVTIVDTIKAELLKGGTQIAGYTDDLDAKTLRAITGSEAFARELERQFAKQDIPLTEENTEHAKKAWEIASQLKTLDEGTKKYMVENQIAPTIDNLYKAQHSSVADSKSQGFGYYPQDNTGYYAKKAQDYTWEQLQPQMEKVMEEAGLAGQDEAFEEAKWIIESGIALTKETLYSLHNLQNLRLPQDMEQILSSIAAAIADGKRAEDANLKDPESSYEKAFSYIEAFSKIANEAVDEAVEKGESITLLNLQKEQQRLEEEGGLQKNAARDTQGYESLERENLSAQQIHARRQLEEVRLMMTVQANRKLLESGYSIDTTELEKLVDALKRLEDKQGQLLWKDSDEGIVQSNNAILRETQQKLAQIPYLPAAVIGKIIAEEDVFTLNNVYDKGNALKNTYDAASQSYETLMTMPRADMGDSIKKAFRNVDAILGEMGLEESEYNRRAVRILGYNSMDITEENIDLVKKYDLDLRNTIRKMTPATTIQAIRDGKNPLTLSMDELNQYLDSLDSTADVKEDNYSKFLYKLEKNKEISPTEREAYIGIYRMFRQLEKTEDAALGSLLKGGNEITFENLLTAMGSAKKKGMDYSVDDSFGGAVDTATKKSIAQQIQDGFGEYQRKLAGTIADTLEPEFLQELNIAADTSLEELASWIETMKRDETSEWEYNQEQMNDFRELSVIEESVVRELMDYGQPLTPEYLSAAARLKRQSKNFFQKLQDLAHVSDNNNTVINPLSLQDETDSKEKLQSAYEKLREDYSQIIEEEKTKNEVTYVDLKALQSIQKQLTLATELSKEENYQIPVELEGELTTIHLKVLHGAQGGKVSAVMQTEEYGQVAAQFQVRAGGLSGYIACDTRYGVEELTRRKSAFEQNIAKALQGEKDITLGSIGVVYSKEANVEGYEKEDLKSDDTIQTAGLYKVAKAFIETIIK